MTYKVGAKALAEDQSERQAAEKKLKGAVKVLWDLCMEGKLDEFEVLYELKERFWISPDGFGGIEFEAETGAYDNE